MIQYGYKLQKERRDDGTDSKSNKPVGDVLFGGSILAGGDVLAEAMKNRIAEKYVIVGGAGHTTETLRQCAREEHPELDVDGKPEAEVFQKYLNAVHHCHADYLEIKSTNCGNTFRMR